VPAPPDERDQRLEVLSETIAQLIRRQSELEQRVRALESPGAASPPPLPVLEPPAPAPFPSPDSDGAVVDAPPPLPEPVPLETTIGLNWINRIAVVTLLLGTAFLFKYGVDNDWFGPGVRVAMGLAAAIISLLAGDRVWRRGQTVFAQGVIGLGVALLYLSIYAAAMLYQLIPSSLAFVAMGAVTGGTVGLAVLYNSQAIAVLALIGGYLTPPALSTGENHPWILFGYVFVLNLAAMLLARMRRWRALEPIAAAATIILYAGWFSRWVTPFDSNPNRPVATVFAFAFYAQFSVAKSPQLWAVFQLVASIALAVIWQDNSRFVWWNLPLAAAGLLRKERLAPLVALASFWLPYRFWYTADAPFAALSTTFLLFFGWSLWRIPRDFPGLSAVAANAAFYFVAAYTLLNPEHHQYMGLLAAAIGGIHLLLARNYLAHDYEGLSEAQSLILGVALAFITLAVPIQFAGFRVTIAWALEGAVLAWLAARSSSQWLRVACWIVLALAIVRLLALDVFIYAQSSEYGTLLNTRFLTFAVSTAALWLSAKFLAPGSSKKELDAAVAYIAGHAVLLFGLSLEIGGWVSRNVVPDNQSSVQIVAISVMMTVYAVILVMIGVKTRAAIHRMLGLALVVLVVAKLYLIDVWVLGRLFRITAFLALGVLLLALSYLYSRLRPVLDRLLRNDSSTETTTT